ncbi:MAG: DUF5675 family protein [Prevotella sp.]|jgi:hypothetical protein|nr:DUF5675 family protein [Prevotella sp.]MCI1281874.1 DUF5675 family protein [Prevotella sp.]
MEITIKRFARRKEYVIGHLYVSGCYLCDTLEPLPGCIPEGSYRVLITKSPKFGCWLPLLCGVPKRTAIRIHAGNTPRDSRGCILVGKNTEVGRLSQSQYYLKWLIQLITKGMEKEKVMISINK